MTTTLQTITDEQIEALRRGSAEAGDSAQDVICMRAQGADADDLDFLRAAATDAEKARALAMSMDEARAECARVIADAEAMQD